MSVKSVKTKIVKVPVRSTSFYDEAAPILNALYSAGLLKGSFGHDSDHPNEFHILQDDVFYRFQRERRR